MSFEFPIPGPEAYVADPCVLFDNTTVRFTTKEGIEYVRTPDSAFAGLADAGYPWEPNYVTIDGMRMHYIDVTPSSNATTTTTTNGDGDDDDDNEIVLMLHGQPSWSFLYRKMIPVLQERGFRVICLDWLGMGRSDKPTNLDQHTYLKQVSRLKQFIQQVIPEAKQTPTINVFVQDWGSLIGLRTVGDEPDWFRRVIVANGLLPVLPAGINPFTVPSPVNYNCSDRRTAEEMLRERFSSTPCGLDETCFSIWIHYAMTQPYWHPSDVLQFATVTNLSAMELIMYNAPYPERTFSAAVRVFPSMLAAVREPEFGNRAAWDSLGNFTRPFLALAGEMDRNLGSVPVQSNLYNHVPGAKTHTFEHRRYPMAGHFIQEDAGREMASYVADFIDGTPIEAAAVDDNMGTDPPTLQANNVTSAGDLVVGGHSELMWNLVLASLVMLFLHRKVVG